MLVASDSRRQQGRIDKHQKGGPDRHVRGGPGLSLYERPCTRRDRRRDPSLPPFKIASRHGIPTTDALVVPGCRRSTAGRLTGGALRFPGQDLSPPHHGAVRSPLRTAPSPPARSSTSSSRVALRRRETSCRQAWVHYTGRCGLQCSLSHFVCCPTPAGAGLLSVRESWRTLWTGLALTQETLVLDAMVFYGILL